MNARRGQSARLRMELVHSCNKGTIWMSNWEGIWRRVLAAALTILIGVANAGAAPPMDKNFYLPDAAASKIVSVSKQGNPEAEVIVLTEAVAIKGPGPKETVAKFGEGYAFSPPFIASPREGPTL